MTSDKFALEIIQSTLSGLGYSATAKRLNEEIEEKQGSTTANQISLTPPESSFKSWLKAELFQGTPYKEAIEKLEHFIEHGQHPLQESSSDVDVGLPNKLEATVILYLIRRILFLSSVVGLSYTPLSPSSPQFTSQSVPIESLLTFLTSDLLPLLDKIQSVANYRQELSAFLSHQLVKSLTRERESAVLMPLVIGSPIHPQKFASTVFNLNTLLASPLTPRRDDIIVSPTYESDIGLLTEVLVWGYLEAYLSNDSEKSTKTSVQNSTTTLNSSHIPQGYLNSLLTQASSFQRIVSPYYLPSRTSPELPSTIIPPFSANQTLKNNFPTSLIHTLNTHTSEIWFVKFSPSGKYLVTGSKDGKMIIYDVTRPKFPILASFRADDPTDTHAFVGSYKPTRRNDPLEQRGVIYCSWDETENYIVCCGLDTIVRVWDVSAIKNNNTEAPKRITRSMDLGEEPSGIELISCFTLGENIRVRSCQFIPRQVNNTRWPLSFVVGSPDKALKMFDLFGNEHFDFFCDTTDTDNQTDEIKMEEEEVEQVIEKKGSTPSRRSTSTGTTTASAGTVSSLSPPLAAATLASAAAASSSPPPAPSNTNNVNSASSTSKFLQSSFNRVIDFEITPDKKILITANNDRSIHFYTVPDLTKEVLKSSKLASINLKGKLSSISVSANGKYFLVNVSQELQLWDISEIQYSGKPILVRRFIGHRVEDDVIRAGFGYLNTYGGVGGDSAFGEELVLSGSADGFIYIWKLTTGQLIQRIQGHVGVCSAVDWNRFYTPQPSGKDYGQLWCSIGDDHLAKIWGPPGWK
ncbi:hypothetical protein CLIB1423_33S00826 [[Candida] railenensis]|uniref:Uncharacterized protein n=1 Tax=[Candida] railenensis TaxID=45579 RepID=A0A9P0W049_9ASCO|nr:hypothetical protein CLIB1423_33S00826 [[Candida] railenensis]